MFRKPLFVTLLAGMGLLALALAACAGAAPTATPTPTPQPPALGTEGHPILVYFVPSAEIDRIVAGGEVLRQALQDATGLQFEVFVPTSYAAAIEGMCAAPGDTMGFPATLAYVVANARCGVDASMISIRFGWDVYWGEYIVPRDSDMQTIEDLNGKTWGFTDPTSTSGHVIPLIDLQAAGVQVADKVPTGGHPQAVLAVYNGEVDFATVYFSPPLLPEGRWEPGDPPEPYADILDECLVNEEGQLYCGGYRVLDARSASGVVSVAPDVVQKVRILDLTDAIPNDCLAFGPDFPSDLRQKIEQALLDMVGTDAWNGSLQDFYSWDGIRPASDQDYDGVRAKIEQAGFSMDEIVGFLEEQ